ncbi:cutinase [Talaromyces proteolyticus]|uniref:Cutinase n=1 Tax=Talaromyces proteolyticus TaxID=1131652 RepID=A0AAD4PSM3_9EURO|nr:cutinase [Talaromyces proteolyticus]KAH8689323.1 cutinase [Talaromyces proteolyticus]
MRFTVLSSAILLAAVNFGDSAAAALKDVDDCSKYVLLSVRGTGEKQGPSIGFKGMISTTLKTVKGGTEYDVVYPANTDRNSTQIGVEDLENYIHHGLQTCPNQKYGILGYSQGATVALTAIKDLTGTPAEDAIGAVLFIGNPFQVRGQLTTFNQTGGDSTRDYNGVLLFTNPSIGLSEHWVISGKALNICDDGDSVCTGVDQLPSRPHYLYGFTATVQKLGAEHLVSRFK